MSAAQVNAKGTRRSSIDALPIRYVVSDRLAPISAGQSVSTLQYTMIWCASGRRRRTRKMRLRVSSIVSISITAVTTRNARPIVVSRPACSVNDRICSLIVSTPSASGRKFSNRKSCSVLIAASNTGNAVESDSATARSGTIESSVVKVRLPAACAQRSS